MVRIPGWRWWAGRQVRCTDCGFLTLGGFWKDHQVQAFPEVSSYAREKAQLSHPYECFHSIRVFPYEDHGSLVTPEREQYRQQIEEFLDEEFRCPRFCRWSRDLSPKEHLDRKARRRILGWTIVSTVFAAVAATAAILSVLGD